MKTIIITKETGAGHFEVTVMQDHNELGTFETNNMGLIDDIYELNNDGQESDLMDHETFKELVETCLNKLKN